MKRVTTYQINLVLVSNEQDSYADPYAKLRYERETLKYGDESEVEKAFRLFKKNKTCNNLSIVRASIERVTTTLLKEWIER